MEASYSILVIFSLAAGLNNVHTISFSPLFPSPIIPEFSIRISVHNPYFSVGVSIFILGEIGEAGFCTLLLKNREILLVAAVL